jgi:hypothetical protein
MLDVWVFFGDISYVLIEQELVNQSPELLVVNLFAEQTEASFPLLSQFPEITDSSLWTNISQKIM